MQQVRGRVVSMDPVLRDIMRPSEKVFDAMREAQEATGYTLAELRAMGRSNDELSAVRQWVMWRAYENGATAPQIGRVLRRDHTTVLHGIRRTKQRIEELGQ